MSPNTEKSENNGYINSGYEKEMHHSSLDPNILSTGFQKEPKVAVEPPLDFDDLLPYIGEFGRYQKILFLFMIPFAFFVAFVYFAQIFIVLVPEEHWCAVPELANLTMDQRLVTITIYALFFQFLLWFKSRLIIAHVRIRAIHECRKLCTKNYFFKQLFLMLDSLHSLLLLQLYI